MELQVVGAGGDKGDKEPLRVQTRGKRRIDILVTMEAVSAYTLRFGWRRGGRKDGRGVEDGGLESWSGAETLVSSYMRERGEGAAVADTRQGRSRGSLAVKINGPAVRVERDGATSRDDLQRTHTHARWMAMASLCPSLSSLPSRLGNIVTPQKSE